jgi:hypothetical protein
MTGVVVPLEGFSGVGVDTEIGKTLAATATSEPSVGSPVGSLLSMVGNPSE